MEELVKNILSGDKKSLEELVKQIQNNIYNLSLKFLWSREDAEDATQEILIKVVSHLGKFEFKSKFNTWVYRIAVNHLLNTRKNKLEEHLNFTSFGEDLSNGLQPPSYDLPDKNLLTEEVKIGCTLGMLICLNRNLRMAYILGEVFELNSNEAADVLEITPENFRKRFSKAKILLRTFMKAHCGLTNKANPCRCDKRINYAIETGRVKKDSLTFISPEVLNNSKTEMDELYSTRAIYKSHPIVAMNANKSYEILNILSGVKFIL